MQELTQREAEQILDRLEEIEEKIDAIQWDLDVMMQIHEMVNPEALERAREQVEQES